MRAVRGTVGEVARQPGHDGCTMRSPHGAVTTMTDVRNALRALPRGVLAGLRRGIEKESLRVRPDGALATTPHPAALGSALTHPHITTDFSEAQLELITGVHDERRCLPRGADRDPPVRLPRTSATSCSGARACRATCRRTTRSRSAATARSNVGRAKTVYRIGLSHRYGRRMQTISGIHYNFSLPAAWPLRALERTRLLRADPQLPPACLAAALPLRRLAGGLRELRRGPRARARELAPGTLYLPHATSLRMGRLGYQSDAQASLAVSYNNLASYAARCRRR